MRNYFFIVVVVFCCLLGCQKEAWQPNEIIKKSLNFHGGLKAMDAQMVLRYDKKTQYYDSLGTPKIASSQRFYYHLKKDKAILNWFVKDSQMQLSKMGKNLNLSINRIPQPLKPNEEKNFDTQLKGGLYVYWQPYKIWTDKANSKYLGRGLLQGSPVHIIEFSYENSTDIWQYYFDIKSFRLLGNRVLHEGRYSLIINNMVEEVSGFKLAKQRTSYRVTANNEILWKQASYVYDWLGAIEKSNFTN